jgi:hypothetical protein
MEMPGHDKMGYFLIQENDGVLRSRRQFLIKGL